MPNVKNYSGGCHCGNVRYDVTMDASEALSCNCSHCRKRGLLLAFVQPEKFALRAGEDTLVDYQFNKKIIHHLFCPICGIESFGRGRGPDGAEMIAINVRCLDDIDLDAVTLKPFDGKYL